MQVCLRHSVTGQQQIMRIQDISEDGCAYSKADIVYSDPPWSPGCLKWWYTYAGRSSSCGYEMFLASLCARIARVTPQHVFIEQSINTEHREMLLSAIGSCASWMLPLAGIYECVYGRPRRPNVLLHWGFASLRTDPSMRHGVDLVRVALQGTGGLMGRIIYDPCMGKGATSRVAHEMGASFVGHEMNSRRAGCAIGWLKRHGYSEQ